MSKLSHDVSQGAEGALDAAPSASPIRWPMTAIFGLCLLGAAASIELTRIHLFVHTDPSYHSVCAMSEGVNCETVAISPYSVFAALPVSVWGIVGYAVMGLLSLWSLSRYRLHERWPGGLMLVLIGFSAATSAILAVISATKIDSLCLFCMATYTINFALVIVAILMMRRLRSSPWELVMQDLRALFARPLVAVACVLAGCAGVGSVQAMVEPYWEQPGWSDIPELPSGVDDQGHHWIGARDPVIEIVEFSDYECPHCRGAHRTIRLVVAEHPDQIRLIHRHLPLDTACHPRLRRPFHQHACRFAEAAECAGLQGRFWAMNDALFSMQDEVRADDVDLMDVAVRLGLDRSAFRECLEERQVADRIAEDLEEAIGRRLRGTPTFIVGERVFLGRIPEAEIDRMLGTGPQ